MSVWIDLPEAEMAQRYEAGESTIQLGHAYGVSYPTISSHLRRAGVEIRAHGGQPGGKNARRRGGPLYTHTGGYLITLNREGEKCSVHRACWEAHHGLIPEGCVVHHLDGNPANNDIENLSCMTQGEHVRLHAPEKGGTR